MIRKRRVILIILISVLFIFLASCGGKDLTISFDTHGGTPVEEIMVEAESLIDFSGISTTREGYTFLGWYLDETLTTKWQADTDYAFQSMTLHAKWEINTYTVTFETYGGTTIANQSLTYGSYISLPEDPIRLGYLFSGWYSNQTLSDEWHFDQDVIEENMTLYAYWVEEDFDAYISTPQQLLGILGNGGSAKYAITEDLDFTGIDVIGSGSTFSGVLDGLGHTISNIDAVSDVSKQGVFFKYFSGTIKNMVIKDSTYETGGEAGAFLVAHAHGGATFHNIEFTNVSVYNPGAYGALLYGDNANDETSELPVTVSKIIVVNNDDHHIVGKNYTGGLIGYLRNSQTVNMSDIYVDSDVISNTQVYDQVAGSLIGRIAGISSVVNIDQAVIKGYTEASKNVGAIIGTSVAGAILNASHVFIDQWTALSGTTAVNTLVGNVNGMTMSLSDVYYVSDRVSLHVGTDESYVSQSPTQGTSILTTAINTSWFSQSGFNSFYKLSTNTLVLNRETGPITETGISAIEKDMKITYLIGESLDLTGLVVKKNFSDGTSEALLPSDYSIDTTSFNHQIVGEYTLIVTYDSFTDYIVINVVDVTHITVEPMYVDTLYLSGEDLDLSNLIVKGILTDGDYIIIDREDYIANTNYDKNIAGDYDVTISFNTYSPVVFSVSVITNPITPLSGMIEITVDQQSTVDDGTILSDRMTFKTVKNALLYVDKSNLTDDVLKYVYIMNGIYEEKLTIDIPNIIFVGESQENTILTYGAASGTAKPEGGVWGTQGSASVSVKSDAWGFTAYNLTFENSFDYENSVGIADKKAVAIVIESDMSLFYKVSFIGVQDTLYAKKGRQYYYQCYIEGAVDFIFGNAGPAFFEESMIHVVLRSTNDSGVIATNMGFNDTETIQVQYGYVFYNNIISADAGYPLDAIDLGRPWRQPAKVAYINNTLTDRITLDGWTDMSGNLPENAYFYEYDNVDASSQLLPTSTYGKDLTALEAAYYINKDIVFGTINGQQIFNVAWDYQARLSILTALET